MYLNEITNKITEHPYRFKTEDEFEEEFGENWMRSNSFMFPLDGYDMEKYFGVDFLLDYDIDSYIDDFEGIRVNGYRLNGWYISKNMLTKNKILLNNKPTKLVYEKLEGVYCIIYKCSDVKETQKVIDLLRVLGKDVSKIKNDLSDYNYIIIRVKVEGIDDVVDDKDYIYGTKSKWSLDRIVKFFNEKKSYVVYGCDNILELKKLLVNSKEIYNKPTNLVYERKILSFKKFNNK